jgi:hypothetical protein
MLSVAARPPGAKQALEFRWNFAVGNVTLSKRQKLQQITVSHLRFFEPALSIRKYQLGEAMAKYLVLSIVLACSVACGTASAIAQRGNAPCSSFQKLPDGKWKVLKAVKIEHGTQAVMLSANMTIGPGTKAVGVDLYAALQKSCH